MTRAAGAARAAGRWLERAGRAHWQHRVLEGGVDVTRRSEAATALVVAPHPDDETLGCGATIARKRAAETPVWVIVAADGSGSHRSGSLAPGELARIRATEVRQACHELGVEADAVALLGHPDDGLQTHIGELVAAVSAALERFRPDEVLTASGADWHPDHQACSAAVRSAVAACPEDRRPRLLEFPVWLWVHGPWAADVGGPWAARRVRPFAAGLVDALRGPTAELVVARPHLATKARALRAHRSQLVNLTGEPEWPVFEEGFVASFFGTHEVTFPISSD